jgi:hypothetical protein
MHSHKSLEFTVDGQERMEEYLFGEIPADLSLSGKLMFYLIRLSEGMIIYGVFSPWLESRAFGAQQSGWDLGEGKLIIAVVLIGATVGYMHIDRVPLSRVALGASLVGVLTFLLAYTDAGSDTRKLFDLQVGIYITMAGGVLRAVLGYVLHLQLQMHEQLMALFGESTLESS